MFKKIAALLLTALILVGCCACHNNEGNGTKKLTPRDEKLAKIAMTVGKYEISALDFQMYYMYFFNSFLSTTNNGEDYGLDVSTDAYKNETCSLDSTVTWGEYLRERGETYCKEVFCCVAAAEKQSLTLSDEDKEELQSNIDDFSSNAKKNSYTDDEFAEYMYGEDVTFEDVKRMCEYLLIYSKFYDSICKTFDITEADMDAYYVENKESIDTLTIRAAAFQYSEDIPDGYSEYYDTKEVALTKAQDFMKKAKNEDVFADLAEELLNDNMRIYYGGMDYTYTCNVSKSSFSGATDEDVDWLFSNDRKYGDKRIVDIGYMYLAVFYIEKDLKDYNTVNFRHILVDTKEEADTIYAEWKDGEATEESFAELANKYSTDEGSNTTGGIYTNVFKGQMVSFIEKWYYDENRKPGDTSVIQTSYGYHVIYFSGHGDYYRYSLIKATMENQQYFDYIEDEIAKQSITTNDDIIASVVLTAKGVNKES